MSSNLKINATNPTAPTPQNTPLVSSTIGPGLSKPTIPATVSEEQDDDEEDDDGDEDPLTALTVEAKRSLAGILGVQVKQTELQQEFKREVWALERKYLARTNPLYERRNAIITGTSSPTAEEIAAGEAQAAKEAEEDGDESGFTPLPEGNSTASIPEFWLTALRNHIGISELITERDAGALKYLTDLRLSYLEGDQLGFKLSFCFSPNDYFSDDVLEKTYLYKNEIDYSGDFIYDRAFGTVIRWKEEQDLTKEFEVRKQRNKKSNRIRLVRKALPTESFFNFFSPPSPPNDDDEMDEDAFDALEELESRLELDYQIGEDIRDRIIPRAVDYFTGKALKYDAEELDEDEFDEDEDDEEDEEEDDTDEDGPGVVKGRSGKHSGSGKKGEAPEECKQQ